MSQVVSIMPKSRPDLFEAQMSVFSKEYKEMNSINVTNIVETTKKKNKLWDFKVVKKTFGTYSCQIS